MFKKWSKLTNPTSCSMVANPFKWYHISRCGINHTRWWFHKWSSTLSDHQMKNASLTYKSSSLANGWPMLWHKGRCPTDWYQGQRSYEWYLKSYPNGVIPTYEVMSIKNARFKCQPSTPMQPFVSRDAHLLWKLMTKEERLVQRYWGKLDLDMNMEKREQYWGIEKDQNSRTREVHK